ncbi:hypothetical protein [Bartonella senegalensis]|uniref:hypothetical protein n=1 Tax=Bartonella senegalensis TaxID=1468418 RepID=UPI0002E199B9|nr:hypothetical protein [Bartonella senegalensis]
MNNHIYSVRQDVIHKIHELGMNSKALKGLFGWDSPTVNEFINTAHLIVTLPHANPNVFFPRVFASWYAHHLQCINKQIFHLRIVLSHINFSDLGWRPYAWWYFDSHKKIQKMSFFTRNKKNKHVTVISQPSLPEAFLPDMDIYHLEAYSLATQCTNRAWSYVAMMASIERAAGLSIAQRTMYITMDQFLAAISKTAELRLSSLLQQSSGRILDNDGKLKPAKLDVAPLVYDNATNIALISTLGTKGIIGGKKMFSYWSDVASREKIFSAEKYRPMEVLLIPDAYKIAEKMMLSRETSNQLMKLGIPYSQGLALSEHGRFSEVYSPF